MDFRSPIKLFLDAAVIVATFAFNAVMAQVDWPFVAIAIGGSVSGSIVLGYFRRDRRLVEQLFKMACAAISGVVMGAAIDEWLALGNVKFSLGIFFTAGFVSLAVLRATLQLTERHTLELLRDVILRLLGLPPRGGNNGGNHVD